MPRPIPLRTDGSNAFARYSMQERVPRIAREVAARNPDYPPETKRAIERLAVDIERDALVPAPRAPAPDVSAWRAAHAGHQGETWLDAEWFYAELAFYRELNAACRFWEVGRDPFGPVKEEEIASDGLWARLEAALGVGTARDERVFALLDACLWGNRVDLSYTIAAARTERHDDDLLVDERAAAVPFLVRPGGHVHVVADNTGTELAMDLALLGALLEDGATTASLHLKIQPTFVSDAMPRDVLRLLEKMRERDGAARSLARRLEACLAEGRLVLLPESVLDRSTLSRRCARLPSRGARIGDDRRPQGRRELPSARRRCALGSGDAFCRGLLGRPGPPRVLADDEERPRARPAAGAGRAARCGSSDVADRRPTRRRASLPAVAGRRHASGSPCASGSW